MSDRTPWDDHLYDRDVPEPEVCNLLEAQSIAGMHLRLLGRASVRAADAADRLGEALASLSSDGS